jgi:predicted secreted hydrolase
MRRRHFLATPLLLPALVRAAPAAATVAYAPVTPGVRLAFPRDHGAHPEFRTEWWYVTGALDSPLANVGFQLTFFRSRPGTAEALRSPIAARHILFAHAALTIPGDRLRHAERAARANLGASFSSLDLDVSIGAWRMVRQLQAPGEVLRLQMQSPQFSFDLTLTPSQPLLLQGDQGYSRKGHGPELASYYVSWPQLQVGGTLLREGRRQAVSGQAWFDHEWSTTLLGDRAVGWDWLGINLSDGGALMAFRMRDAAGETLYAHAAWRDAAGRVRCRRGQFHAPAPLVVATQRRQLSSAARHPLRRADAAHAAGPRRPGTIDQSPGASGLLGGAGQGRGQPQRSRLPGNDRLRRAAAGRRP